VRALLANSHATTGIKARSCPFGIIHPNEPTKAIRLLLGKPTVLAPEPAMAGTQQEGEQLLLSLACQAIIPDYRASRLAQCLNGE
jgi:hypothetical protein